MKKNLLLLLILTGSIVSSQNKELIKKTFLNQSIDKIDNIAIENGLKAGETVYVKAFFKSDISGSIFDIVVDEKSKIFESEIISIINQIPKLNADEYLHKGQEMKYGLKIYIKLATNKERKRRIKKGSSAKIKYKGFYVKEYFPVKWIEYKEVKKSEFSKIEEIPITESCKNVKDEIEIRNCVSRDIQKHIGRKFDVDLAQELGLPQSKQRVIINFVISKTGEVVNVKADASHDVLIEEGVRVINCFPNFYKPGTIDGKPVNVKYSIPISFMIH